MSEITGQFLYIAGPCREGPLKIGITKNPKKRLLHLQNGSARTLYMFWVYPCPHGKVLEPIMHRILAESRLNGEWFDAPVEHAMAALWIASNTDEDGIADTDIEQWRAHIGFH